MAQTNSETEDAAGLPMVAEVSRGIVGLHARHYGRGPTEAKTIWREEILVCILRDAFSRPERLLVESGRFESVRSHRSVIQDAISPSLAELVESITGRRVRSVLSQISPDGVACEVFVLDRQERRE